MSKGSVALLCAVATAAIGYHFHDPSIWYGSIGLLIYGIIID